jgi:hypothetical protein
MCAAIAQNDDCPAWKISFHFTPPECNSFKANSLETTPAGWHVPCLERSGCFNNHDRQQNQLFNNYERINQSRNDNEYQLLRIPMRQQTRRQRVRPTASRRTRAGHAETFQTPAETPISITVTF